MMVLAIRKGLLMDVPLVLSREFPEITLHIAEERNQRTENFKGIRNMRMLIQMALLGTMIGAVSCGKSTPSAGEKLRVDFWSVRATGSYLGDQGSWTVVVMPDQTSGAWELNADSDFTSRGSVQLQPNALFMAFEEARRVDQEAEKLAMPGELNVRITYESGSMHQVVLWSGDYDKINHAFIICPQLGALHERAASELTKGYWFRYFGPPVPRDVWNGSTTRPNTALNR